MSQNPLAVLAAMLGGGFQGYGQAQQRQTDNANRDRLFNLEYDKFKADNSLARDKFGLDQELGRGSLGVQQGNLDLGNRELGHRERIDFARLRSDDANAAANRATSTRNTQIGVGGRENFDRQDRDEQGRVWLERWQMDLGQSGPGAVEAYKRLTEMRRLKRALPGLSDGEAAYRAAQVAAAPGNEDYVQRSRPAMAGMSFGSTPPAVQATSTQPQPGAGSQATGQTPPSTGKPMTREEWQAEADKLLAAGKSPEEILSQLGSRPPQ